MRFPVYSLILVLILTISACRTNTPELCDDCLSFKHDGENRLYFLYKPDDLPANAPLVFFLHGYYGTADGYMDWLDAKQYADTYDMAVCFPQGLGDNRNVTHWNANFTISDVDDIGFLTSLANELQSEHGFDQNRIFTCGFSNGGFMSYALACSSPFTFRAIGSIAGTMGGETWNTCNPSIDVPILQISAEDDQIVPIDGSISSAGGWGGAPHMDQVIEHWVDRYQCATSDTTAINAETTSYIYSNGSKGGEVHYYKIKTLGHKWPGEEHEDATGINATDLLFQFFETF